MASATVGQSGIVSAQNPTGQIYPVSGQGIVVPNPTVPTTTPPPVTPAPTPSSTAPIIPPAVGTQTQGSGNNNPGTVGTYGPTGTPTGTTATANPAPFGKDANGNPYGGQNSNDPNPNSSVYGNGGTATGNTGTSGTGNTGTGTTSLTGDPNEDALINAQNAQAAAQKQLGDTISGILNGSIPLSAADQAQVQGLENQYAQTIATQNLVNTNGAGTANLRGYQTGAAEYDPTFQAKTINAVLSAGATKIATLQTSEASAVAQLTESLQDNDIKGIQEAYDAYTASNSATQDALKTTIASTQGAMNDASIQSIIASGVTDPGAILQTLQTQGKDDITLADINTTIAALSPDAAAIYSTAQTATEDGADPATVKLIMAAPDKQTALNILAQSGVANTNVSALSTKYPDAGILPTDSLSQAQAKVLTSPSYETAEKSAILDNNYKQAEINKDEQASTDLTSSQQTVLNEATTNLAGTQQYKDFSQVASVYATIAGIDPSTINSVQEGQLAYALAQMEVPGAKTVRGALQTAASPLNMNSGVYNLLQSAQNLIDSKKPLSPDMVNQMMAAANSIYDTSEQSYSAARNSVISSASARIGSDATPYMPDLSTDTGVDEIRATNAINIYVGNNPTTSAQVKTLLSVPGATEADVLAYMKQSTSGFPNYGDLP